MFFCLASFFLFLGTPTAQTWPEGCRLASAMGLKFPQVINPKNKINRVEGITVGRSGDFAEPFSVDFSGKVKISRRFKRAPYF